jgi:hypothetical protein
MKCIYHAIKLFIKNDGYIWIRRSKFCEWIPHFGWSKGVKDSKHWQPDNTVEGWKVLFHMFVAKGKVKKGK